MTQADTGVFKVDYMLGLYQRWNDAIDNSLTYLLSPCTNMCF